MLSIGELLLFIVLLINIIYSVFTWTQQKDAYRLAKKTLDALPNDDFLKNDKTFCKYYFANVGIWTAILAEYNARYFHNPKAIKRILRISALNSILFLLSILSIIFSIIINSYHFTIFLTISLIILWKLKNHLFWGTHIEEQNISRALYNFKAKYPNEFERMMLYGGEVLLAHYYKSACFYITLGYSSHKEEA